MVTTGVRSDLRAILVKSTGGAGLGDSIRALLAAIQYAHRAQRRIAVSWDDGLYGPRGENIFPSLFQLVDLPLTPVADLDPISVHPAVWRERLELPFGDLYAALRGDGWDRTWALRHLSADQRRLDYPEATVVVWDFERFASVWRLTPLSDRLGTSPDEAMGVLARRHLRLTPAVQGAVDAFRRARFLPRMIGVHIRKTAEATQGGKQVDEAAVIRAIDARRRRHPEAGLLLATDNQAVVERMQRRYPDLTLRDKWFPAPGEPIHFTNGGPDRLARTRDALTEIGLLAACDTLIYPAESSFSRAARYLGGLRDDQVIPVAHPDPAEDWWRRLGRLLRAKVAS